MGLKDRIQNDNDVVKHFNEIIGMDIQRLLEMDYDKRNIHMDIDERLFTYFEECLNSIKKEVEGFNRLKDGLPKIIERYKTIKNPEEKEKISKLIEAGKEKIEKYTMEMPNFKIQDVVKEAISKGYDIDFIYKIDDNFRLFNLQEMLKNKAIYKIASIL
ncbi:MAG: hypothetical protein PHU12_02760 [Candidatus Aenigmarchaeota archaeon]|nr:hypothetical protein [Candidatus Aenigmarchaeota archaeon]